MAKILLNVEVNKSNLKQVEEQLNKVLNPSASTGGKGDKKSAIVNVDNLRKSYANLLNQIKGAEKYFSKGTFDKVSGSAKKYHSELMGLNGTVKLTKEEAKKLTRQLNEVQREFAETKANAKNMHGSLLEIVKGFAKFQFAAMAVMKPLQLIRNAWDSLNETLVKTEDAVISLRRVAGDAANANELYDLAQRYGQTFDSVYEVATNFARAGYSWNETIQATESALLALNTAELDASQASEGMIAIMQQFGYEASDLEGIIDKLNITADNAAVSTEKLLTALQRTGSSAKNANLSLEQTVAIVTSLSEATGRSGENIGTALNSLIQFSTKASSLDTFAALGGDVEAVVERYKQGGATVLDIWRELSNVIKSNQGNSAESILGKGFSSEEFEALNEELKESFGETFAQTTEIYDTASTFRKNYFIALLQNLDQVQESLDTMQKSQGYSQDENLLYLDTYTAKVNALKAKWQEIANDEQGILGLKKGLVDFASFIGTIIQKLGGLKGVLNIVIAVASPFLTKWAITFSLNTINAAIKGVAALFTAIKTGAAGANAALGAIGLILGAATTIINAVNTSKKEGIADISSAVLDLQKVEDNVKNIAKEYSDFEEKLKSYKAILENSTSTEKERENALQNLNEIQNALKDNTNEYANSLDFVNGKLDNQIDKLQKLSFLEQQKALQEFQDSNIDAIVAAKGYLGATSNIINFSDSYGLYAGADSEFSNWLEEQGYKEDSIGNFKDFWEDFGEGFISVFGGKFSTDIATSKMTREQQVAFLEEMFVKAGEIPNKDKRERIQGIIRKAIRGIEENRTFVDSSNLIYGNANASTLFERLSQGQREKLLATTNQEEWNNLLSEWGFLSSNSTSSGGASGSNKTNLSDVVNKLEEIRENTEKTKELEEKQLALQEAKNQRTVRVFNAETGQWEMQSNEKAILAAETSLKDAAMNNIIEYLSTDEAQAKLNSGEFTIPDWLAEMIAQPTSSDSFQAFMTSMGIMSGALSKNPVSSGATYNSSSNNTTNNNQSYSLNGIPIPAQDAGRYFTPEALELLNQMGE